MARVQGPLLPDGGRTPRAISVRPPSTHECERSGGKPVGET